MNIIRQGPRIVMNLARPAGTADVLALAERAAGAGLDGVGFADSPRLFDDPYLSAQWVLDRTELALAGPCVLGLGLHHPAVVARSALTLQAQHPGRGLLVVGRGESSVLNEGLPVPAVAEYDGLLAALRERLGSADGTVVLGAASGPRMIRASARRLGGVLIDVGADPTMVAAALELARDSGAERCWLFLRAVATDTDEQAHAAAAPLVGSCAARMAGAAGWFGLSEADRDRVARVAASHDYRRHGTVQDTDDADPAAIALVRSTFLLTGTAEAIADRLRPFAGAGVDGVVLAGAVPGLVDRLADTAEAVRRGLTQEGQP